MLNVLVKPAAGRTDVHAAKPICSAQVFADAITVQTVHWKTKTRMKVTMMTQQIQIRVRAYMVMNVQRNRSNSCFNISCKINIIQCIMFFTSI